MKYTRGQLKSLIKECLVEILSEGLGGQLVESVNSKQPTREQPSHTRGMIQARQQTAALAEAIKTESRGNAVMASIFEDTAATTLQKQMAHSTPSGDARGPAHAGVAEMIVSET